MKNKELIITREEAIDIADEYGLGNEVIYEMDHGSSPWQALYEWDLLTLEQLEKPNTVAEIVKIFHEQ